MTDIANRINNTDFERMRKFISSLEHSSRKEISSRATDILYDRLSCSRYGISYVNPNQQKAYAAALYELKLWD